MSRFNRVFDLRESYGSSFKATLIDIPKMSDKVWLMKAVFTLSSPFTSSNPGYRPESKERAEKAIF